MDASPRLDTMAAAFSPKSLSSPTQSTENPPIKWHKFHCDPIQDVVLVSNDGMYFRASSHALKRESSLFKAMLSSMPNPYQSSSEAIPLDFSRTAIAVFLSSYTSEFPLHYNKLTFGQLHEHRKLVLYLDCDRLLPAVEQAYSAACNKSPTHWLYLASRDDDLGAGGSALFLCHKVQPPTHETQFHRLVDQLRLTWRYPLLKCVMSGRNPSSAAADCIDWHAPGAVMCFVKEVERAKEELKRG